MLPRNVLAAFDPTSLPSRIAYEFQPYRPQLTEQDLEDLFEFIWRHDSHNYEHPRYRLQVALAILLFYYLGLYPTIALSEGFCYRDTTLAIAEHKGAIRLLLFICLKERHKHQRSGRRWSGTMILVDDPMKRRMCPATIFFSQAIADGVIEGIQGGHELSSLVTSKYPTWSVMKYRPEALDLPIMRRASRNILSSSRALSPNCLHKQIVALAQRGGHERTLATIREDNKKASIREKRRLEATRSDPHMLTGRGQGMMVYELLAPFLQPAVMPWDPNAFKLGTKIVRRLSPLDKVVGAQLRFDAPRAHLISILYGACSLYTSLQDTLQPLIEASSPIGSEPFYPKAEPDEHGNCPWCGICLSRTPMKMHILWCKQNAETKNAELSITASLQQNGWLCKWETCSASHIDFDTISSITTHISHHLSRKKLRCKWNHCNQTMKSIIDLHIHLEKIHNVYTTATLPLHPEYCYACGIWTMSKLDWDMHGVSHAKTPNIIYGPVVINGLLAEAGRCPFCLKQGLYRQIEKASQYLQHVEKHIIEEGALRSLQCPHIFCEANDYETDELREHLRRVHHIPFTVQQ